MDEEGNAEMDEDQLDAASASCLSSRSSLASPSSSLLRVEESGCQKAETDATLPSQCSTSVSLSSSSSLT
jgi:hypothetical protein